MGRAVRRVLVTALAALACTPSAALADPPIWRLEQPPPPAGAPFKVPLGAPGDLLSAGQRALQQAIRLLRLDRDGNIEAVLASDSLAKPSSMPLEFWLPYQPGLIESRQAYAMDAKVVAAGRILFTSQQPVPVLTRGNPTNVEIVVTPFK